MSPRPAGTATFREKRGSALKITTTLIAAALTSLVAADIAFAQPPQGERGAGPGRFGGPGGPGGRFGGPGGRGGPGGGRGGAMPQGDPNVPVLERGGFGPSEMEVAQFRDDLYILRRDRKRDVSGK